MCLYTKCKHNIMFAACIIDIPPASRKLPPKTFPANEFEILRSYLLLTLTWDAKMAAHFLKAIAMNRHDTQQFSNIGSVDKKQRR